MKRVGKTLLVIACVIGITVGGVRLAMDRQVTKMYAQLDAVAVVAPEQVADGIYEGTAETQFIRANRPMPVRTARLK